MEVKNIKGNSKVLILKVGQQDVDGMLINYDLTDKGRYAYMEDELVDVIMNYLPEYSMGCDSKTSSIIELVPLIREAAKSLIKIKRIDDIKRYLDNHTPYDQWEAEVLKLYSTKGIFSEMILHFILRDFKKTIPLISKIYFKDSSAIEAHGFDAVHITPEDKTLWLGESKFYNNGKRGLKALIDDLNHHFVKDYLNDQFIIISRALIHNSTLRDEWIVTLSQAKTLSEKFDMIKIPLLCIYEDQFPKQVIAAVNEQGDIDTLCLDHIAELKSYYDTNNSYINKQHVQILLILLPVESKDKIVAKMLEKIYNMQNI